MQAQPLPRFSIIYCEHLSAAVIEHLRRPPSSPVRGWNSLLSSKAICRPLQVADTEAHLIRSYDAWAIALLLSRAGLYMHTYPQALFSVREWEPALGYEPCVPTRVPDQRRADYGTTAAMLFTDAAQTLHGQQIGVFGRYATSPLHHLVSGLANLCSRRRKAQQQNSITRSGLRLTPLSDKFQEAECP